MGDKSKIQWTDATWNPVRGCSRVSEGCRNCYAERQTGRFSGPDLYGEGFAEITKAGPRWTGKVSLIPGMLDKPLRWKRPRRIFVNSMSDLFHEKLSFPDIGSVFGVMGAASQHRYQILTKRPEVAAEWFAWILVNADRAATTPDILCRSYAETRLGITLSERGEWPLPEVDLGTSVEDQPTADKRITELLRCSARVRFVSYEPALGPVNFRGGSYGPDWLEGWDVEPVCCGRPGSECCGEPEAQQVQTEHLDWIIVGGESGPEARPFDVEWARSAVRQCREAGVPVFVKQLGARPVLSAPEHGWPTGREFITDESGEMVRVVLGDRKGGDWSEWPEDLRIREFPE